MDKEVGQISLRPEIRGPLVDTLTDILSKLAVPLGGIVSRFDFRRIEKLEQKLSKKKETWERLVNFIGEEPLQTFFSADLTEQILSLYPDETRSEKRSPLTSLAEFRDPSSYAEQLVNRIEFLPKAYKLVVEMPYEVSMGLESILGNGIVLADDFAIVAGSDQQRQKYPAMQTQYRDQNFFENAFVTIPHVSRREVFSEDGRYYFEMELRGYMSKWVETRPFIDADLKIRSFFGLGYAFGIYRTFPRTDKNMRIPARIYDDTGFGMSPLNSRTLMPETVRGISRLGLSNQPPGMYPQVSADKRFSNSLKTVSNFLRTHDDPDRRRIARGAQWLFDSIATRSDILAYVQATICLEILLGETESEQAELSISATISNRCAYLIARSRSERDQIKKDFGRIYRTRSKIVHTGQNHLTNEQQWDLARLQRICREVIVAEINLILSDL